MTQRLTPGGQGPARRPGQRSRAAPPRGGRPVSRGAEAKESADTGRSANRPAAARRAPVRRTNAPQPRRFTGRATVLLVVLIALALGYTYPVRVYLTQQSDIARMEQAQEEQRQRISELSEQAALWQDEKYIEIQARKRFYMVRPGEVPLVVLTDPEGAARDAGVPPDAGKSQPADPWYDTMWSSIQAADSTETRK
ncbi:FtsB family cell division protein [Phytohabitans kaempferiae]|uniref:Septum formation initiator family protein n=1 Tax=Phytohabitans kaempferiae TaxID=1620943 RepID=A0ABV6LVN3_9ACTN